MLLTFRMQSLPLDVSETDKEMTIKADVPGMDKSNFSIRVVNNNLEIACERKEEYVREDERTRARERRWGRAVRTLRLQDNIDVPHITSEYVDGVLKVGGAQRGRHCWACLGSLLHVFSSTCRRRARRPATSRRLKSSRHGVAARLECAPL